MNTQLELEFSQMVFKLKKRGIDIFDSLTPRKCDALHMALALSSDVGELVDVIKKWTMYDQPLDLNNAYEELGDVEFFLEGIRQALNINRADTLSRNMRKLSIRYPNWQYSDAAAKERLDKK